ncbi:MAG: hypothetical protein HN696_02900, partial [Euryarchaeota archaeon]|nr:hypothetical protein [Euryarchaeota archaeon]
MSPIARMKKQPRRGKTLVFSMMMIMSVFSAGIPVASATGQNGEWIMVDMSQGNWAFGDTVEANITGGSLDSIPGYTVEWKLEDMNMTILQNGTETISAPASGDSFEYDLSFNNLNEECFNLIAELFDNGGAFVDGSSMFFDVGSGMCQQGPGPSGPHMWWNGSSWFDTTESMHFFAEVGGLDEASDYTLVWGLDDVDSGVEVAHGTEALSMVGQETSIEILIESYGDACYNIRGMLEDSDSKLIPGSNASFMFEVGNATCQTGPSPMVNAYVHFYDDKLNISSYGYEPNQEDLNIHVSIYDEGAEVYALDMHFTADEYGMFSYEDESLGLENGEYPMSVKVTNTADNSTLFEGVDMILYVYSVNGPVDAGVDVWTHGEGYESGEDVWLDYSVWGNEGEYSETIWNCEMIFIPESALQGNHSADNIESKMKDAVLPAWCDTAVDEAMILNGTGGDMFGGETVWVADETMRISYQYNGDLNLTISLYGSGDESSPVEDECNEDIEHVYNSEDDSCEMSMTFITFDVGEEYIWLEEPGEIMFVCGNQQDEIPFDEVNDGDEDCPDGSDEPQDFDSDGITDNWFDCHDGSNVSMDLVNDGTEDCPDGDDEGEGDVEVKGEHLRYSTSTDSVILADMDDVHEQLYDAYIQLWSEEHGFVMNISIDDCEDDKCNLGLLSDGYYSVGGVLVDEDGMTVWNSEHRSNFCVGPDCYGPVWETGNATLNLTITSDEYNSAECGDRVSVMLFHLDELQNDMDNGDHQDNETHQGDGNGSDGTHQGDGNDGDGDDNKGPPPVWADTLEFNTNHWVLDGLPEGNWVVIAMMNCEGVTTGDGDGYDLIGASGGMLGGMHELEFINGSTTDVSLNMVKMERDNGNDNGNDGGLEEYMTGNVVFHIMVEDSPDG